MGHNKHYVSSYCKRRYERWKVKEEAWGTDSLFLGRLKLGWWGVYPSFLRQLFPDFIDWLERTKLSYHTKQLEVSDKVCNQRASTLYFFQPPFNQNRVSVSSTTHAGADIWILITSSIKNFIFYFGIEKKLLLFDVGNNVFSCVFLEMHGWFSQTYEGSRKQSICAWVWHFWHYRSFPSNKIA